MALVLIPSEAVPPPAPVALDLPDGWAISAAPGVTAIAAVPLEAGRFRVNVVITHVRVQGDASLADLVAGARAGLAELADLEGGDDRFVERDGVPAVVREVAFTDPDSGLGLYQLQLQMLVQVGAGVADLVTLSGTCAGDQLEYVPMLRSIAESLRPTVV
ncbi:MAG: hypothetical protein QM733_05480 [Ilumatobacteraceae bacterium]